MKPLSIALVTVAALITLPPFYLDVKKQNADQRLAEEVLLLQKLQQEARQRDVVILFQGQAAAPTPSPAKPKGPGSL